MVGGCLQIEYTGAQASCLLVADATGKTLTSSIGAAGAEAPDADFGAAGVIDLTDATADTLAELEALIDGYDDYTCSILYGDDIPTENILSETVQAKGTPAYVLFVITSVLSPYALTTWARTKEALPGKLKDTDQIFVERLINAATETGEDIARCRFKARDYTKDLDGSDRGRLILPDSPVISVSHVYVDAAGVFGVTTEITDFITYGDSGILALRSGIFPAGIQNVRVVYIAGLNPVHEKLQFAAIECVDWNLRRFRGQGIGLRSSRVDEMDYSYELTIPMNAQRVFESYRRPA